MSKLSRFIGHPLIQESNKWRWMKKKSTDSNIKENNKNVDINLMRSVPF